MKKKLKLGWLDIFLIVCMSISTICWIFVYIGEPEPYNLIQLIVTPTCLAAYVIFLICLHLQKDKKYIIIYDDFFEFYGKSIFNSQLICERQNRKYAKYGVIGTAEKIYLFSHNGFTIKFGISEIDKDRKLMIVYEMTSVPDNFFEVFAESIDKAKKHYYDNHEIEPLEYDDVAYKNKRNAFRIVQEDDGTFAVLKYRHYVVIEFYIKYLPNCNVGWTEIGENYYCKTLDEAEKYVRSLCE